MFSDPRAGPPNRRKTCDAGGILREAVAEKARKQIKKIRKITQAIASPIIGRETFASCRHHRESVILCHRGYLLDREALAFKPKRTYARNRQAL